MNHTENVSNDKNQAQLATPSRRFWSKFVASLAALESLALVFWILSERYHAHWIVSASLLSVTIVILFMVFTHGVIVNFGHALSFWCLCVLLSLGASYAVFRASLPDHTRLIFAFSPNPFSDQNRLEFTNDFFFRKRGEVIRASETEGVLVVPIKPGQSNVSLSFLLINNTDTFCEKAQVRLEISSTGTVEFGDGWQRMNPRGTLGFNALMDCNASAFPPTIFFLPEVKFSNFTEGNDREFCIAHVMGKGFENLDVVLWLVFSSKVTNAHIIKTMPAMRGTNVVLDLENPEYPKK